MTENKQSKLLTVLKIILSIYLILCAISIGLWVYLKFFKPKSFTNSAIYANTVEDINGKKPVMEINSYNNLFELKFNYYTDYNSTDVVSSGVQILNYNNLKLDWKRGPLDWNWYQWFTYLDGENGQKNYDSKNICFYQESDGLSFKESDNSIQDFGCIKIEINGESYALQFGRALKVENGLANTTITTKSSLSLFVKNLYEIFHSGTYDSGTYTVTFPFKDYFDVYKFDSEKYKKIESDIIDTYIYTKFTNYNEEAKTAKDSIFNQVQYNTNWTNDTQDTLLNEHFSDKNYFILTEQNCKFTFDESLATHIADINEASFNEYKDKKQNYTLVFDLDYLKEVGVAFGGINKDGHIKDLNITSYFTLENGVLTEVKV